MSVLLHDFSNTKGLSYVGEPARAEISSEQQFEGKDTLKVVAPRTLELKNGVFPYIYGCFRVRVNFDGVDWREYNRLSFWIYPEKDVYDSYLVSIELKNEGEVVYPREGKRIEGVHFVQVKCGKWNQVIWDIPDVYRDKVTYVQINFEMFGKQKGMSDDMTAYVSTLELQKAEVSKYMGWDTDGNIIVSHSGYTPNSKKAACLSNPEADTFSVIDINKNETVYTGMVEKETSDIGEFGKLDFSEVTIPGKYYIQCGEAKSYVFPIGEDIWMPAVEKIQNFFSKQRCGVEVEGIHDACHLDCYVKHPDGRTLPAYGGWHDAADLSQGTCNTAEATQAFLDTAKALEVKNPELSQILLNEAKQGMDWLLSTRFGDGYRVEFFAASVWTDGEKDSCTGICQPASNAPFENLCAAAAEAQGYLSFIAHDSDYANRCLEAAKEDFSFAVEVLTADTEGIYSYPRVEKYAELVFAANLLYKATKDEVYLKIASEYAEKVMLCQQTEPTDWEIPFVGFFYNDEEHSNTLNYNHRAHDQVIVAALAGLLELAHTNENATKWRSALERYREYILKLKEYAQPYGVLPAGIYFKSQPVRIRQRGKMVPFDGAVYVQQVESGVKLSEDAYLRRFPVVSLYRGCFGLNLTKAKAVTLLGRALNDKELLQIGQDQLKWIVGNNPFNRSYMYGEGYDCPHMYHLFSFDIIGQIPVGMQNYENTDLPYMPMTADATYFEVWVHPVSRFLWTLADLL